MRYVDRSAIAVFGTEDFLRRVKRVRPELHRRGLGSPNHHPNACLVEVEDRTISR